MKRELQRKHREQLTQKEIEFIEEIVHTVDEWKFAPGGHFAQRLVEKRLNKDSVLDALWNGSVIELTDAGTVLMRSKAGACVVADIKAQYLITCWRNAPSDTHLTLDLAEYAWQVDAVAFVKTLRRA